MVAARRIAFVAALSLAAPLSAARPEATVPLEPYRKTIALRATVAGQPGRFVLDTAGGISLITPAFAERIGALPWGRLSGHRMQGDRLDAGRVDGLTFRLGDLALTAPVVGVLDLMSLFPEGAEPVDGLIALDLFAGRALTIDLPAMTLTVESADSLAGRVAGLAELPVLFARELQGRALAASVGVSTGRGTIWLELDTGNGGTLLVSKPYAALLGLDPDAPGPQAADFEVAPGLRARGPAFAPDLILDGNLGMPFLRDLAVTLDLADERLWIARPAIATNRSPDAPELPAAVTSSRRSEP